MAEDIPYLAKRSDATHKGDYGHVVIVAGSVGMTGAAALSTLSALRSGAGLVTLLCPPGAWAALAPRLLEAMVKPVGADGAVGWDAGAAVNVGEFLDGVASPVLAMGPGMRRTPQAGECVRRIIRGTASPLVVDADALVAFEGDPQSLRRDGAVTVLTPHPGEAARLVGTFDGRDDDARLKTARTLANEAGSVVVLKGHRSVITDGERVAINETGNAGMATGGSGDVLTGILASLLGSGMDAFAAARLATHIHGAAGDIAAAEIGQTSLIAGDIVRALPRAFMKHAADS